MENKDIPQQEEVKIGDVLPMASCEVQDTFFLVLFNGERFLVNKEGKVVMKEGSIQKKEKEESFPAQEMKEIKEPEPEPQVKSETEMIQPIITVEPEEPVISPESIEYRKAEPVVRAFIEHFNTKLRRDFRMMAIRLGNVFESKKEPVLTYLRKEQGGLAGLKAYLFRELFARSTFNERGLEIIVFLNDIISSNEDGSHQEQSNLTFEQQKDILIDFLNFARSRGDNEEKKRIFEETYGNFITAEYVLMEKDGGPAFFVNTAFSKALKAQKDFLMNDSNRNYLEDTYRKIMRSTQQLIKNSMLSYLKAIFIIRMYGNSTKDQRGENEAERESLLNEIISYQPK